MYATYEQYKSLGGKLDEQEFANIYPESKFKLEYWTQDRVAEFEDDTVESPYWVIYSIKTIVDSIADASDVIDSFTSIADGDTISEYSNGVETYKFLSAEAGQASLHAKVVENAAYRKVVEAAPLEYITWAVS